jgi:sensor domain CHASE-containing protein
MSLRTRTLLITGSVALILLLALSFSSRLAVLRGFEDVETEAALVDVRRVHSEIADVLEHIRSIGGDWGPWDDTYEFVAAASKTSTSATISATKPWPTSISTSWCSWAPTSGW